MPQRTRTIGAVLLIATGLVWIGLASVVSGVFIGWLGLRTRAP